MKTFSPRFACGYLLHNFWNNEEPARLGRRIPQRVFVGHGWPRFVRPRDIHERKRVGRGFHAAHVGLVEFFNVAKNVPQLRAKFLFLLGRKRNARQMRDIFDINFRSSHAMKLESKVQSSKSKVGPPIQLTRDKFPDDGQPPANESCFPARQTYISPDSRQLADDSGCFRSDDNAEKCSSGAPSRRFSPPSIGEHSEKASRT